MEDVWLRVKEEPGLAEPSSVLRVKHEAGEQTECGAGLFADHEVKEELVLGPTALQPPDVAFSQAVAQKNIDHIFKPIVKSEECDQTRARGLFTEASYKIWFQLRACSVRLERIPDMQKLVNSTTFSSTVEKQTNYEINPKSLPESCTASELYSAGLLQTSDESKKSFPNKRTLRQVQMDELGSIENKKTLKCRYCMKQFCTPYYLVKHERIHTGEKPYKCDICSKQFNNKDSLMSHKHTHTGEKPFKCEICLKEFTQKSVLIQHQHIHTKPYNCEICLKQFSRRDHLNAHKYTHTSEKPYKCELCPSQFTQKMHLTIHKRIHTGDSHKPHKCEICLKQFTRKIKLIVHLNSHAGKKLFECDICSKGLSSKQSLVAHIEGHMGASRARRSRESSYKYTCPACGARFERKERLLRHARRHIWPSERPTDHTAEPTASKRARRPVTSQDQRVNSTGVQRQTTRDIKPAGPPKDRAASEFSCDACGKRLARKRSLIRHLQLHSSDLDTQAPTRSVSDIDHNETPLCPSAMIPSKNPSAGSLQESDENMKSLPNRGILIQVEKDGFVRYELGYTEGKSHNCHYCMKQFYTHSNLVRHERIHTGEKPFKCDICPKQFTVSSSLISHKRIHTGEKPYKCDICLRQFAHSCTLLTHKRTHTGDKPYQCEFCMTRFVQRSALVSHERSHTGEKPYKCDICPKRFKRSSDVCSHKRTHTRDKPYHCEFCMKRFSHKNTLMLHGKTHTGEKPDKM